MDGPSRKPTLLVQRAHVSNRLSQQTLLAVYDRLLRMLARHEEGREDVPEPAISEPFSLSTTGGPL